ncbi:ArgK/MeaB family GTPase [Roseibium sp.]|uniref:ArgK/MeaB family GTPase n=1 Tax=Roseibium sp. TaxID=1936156 RepID=UPI003A969537
MDEFYDPAALRVLSKRALSRLITRLETAGQEATVAGYLDSLLGLDGGHVLGLTGPPGVGKSTLTRVLIHRIRERGQRVAVLAIDPSSRVTGGALLGDRTRLQTDPDDADVFVRSMAAGRRLGGLSEHALAVVTLLRAAFDVVILESVGTGQSEGEVATACDTLCLCMQPGAGDSLQFMKAGIMELPQVIAVTKADLGPAARRTAADINGALSLSKRASTERDPAKTWTVPVVEISSTEGTGLDMLLQSLEGHRHHLQVVEGVGRLRAAQQELWLEEMIRQRFGSFGLEKMAVPAAPDQPVGLSGKDVFQRFLAFSREFKAGISPCES